MPDVLVHTAADLRRADGVTRRILLAMRLSWLGVAACGAWTFSDLAPPNVVTIAGSTAWFVVAVAGFVPHVLSYAVARLLAPGAVVAAIVALAVEATPSGVTLFSVALVATVCTLSPTLGEWWANGTSYPNERRLVLRTPPVVLLTACPLAFIGAALLPMVSVLSFASDRPVVGIACAVGAAWFGTNGIRVVAGLARRWLVVVPAGVVVHDLVVVIDPVLVPNHMIQSIEVETLVAPPARTADDVLDTCGGVRRSRTTITATEPIGVSMRTRGGITEMPKSSMVVALQQPQRLAQVRALQKR